MATKKGGKRPPSSRGVATSGKTAKKAGRAPAKSSKAASPRAAKSDALQQSGFMAAAQGEAKTVIYIHGIGNKPTAEVLRCQWDKALFGRGMGERTRLAYWVNRDRYPTPEPGTCGDRDQGPTINQAEQRVLSALGVAPSRRDLGELADALAGTPAESEMLHAMLDEMGATGTPQRGPGKRGLFDKVNEILLKLISAALLQDVHDFF